jgi:small acid-soluble spore protein D (minor alpha/beta-type SASP)
MDMPRRTGKKTIAESKKGLYKFRNEIAKEMGVPFSDYNGHLTAMECGVVGGEMVKRMVIDYEKKIK